MLSNEVKLNIAKNRYKVLVESPKNIKCPGVLRKLRRNIRNLEKSLLKKS